MKTVELYNLLRDKMTEQGVTIPPLDELPVQAQNAWIKYRQVLEKRHGLCE